MNPEVLATVPSDITHTMATASIIAAVVRLGVLVLKTPLLGDLWHKMPWFAKPAVLLGLSMAGGVVDAVAFGQPWFLALGSSVTGLGGAVVSHEWQSLFAEAAAAKAAAAQPPVSETPSAAEPAPTEAAAPTDAAPETQA